MPNPWDFVAHVFSRCKNCRTQVSTQGKTEYLQRKVGAKNDVYLDPVTSVKLGAKSQQLTSLVWPFRFCRIVALRPICPLSADIIQEITKTVQKNRLCVKKEHFNTKTFVQEYFMGHTGTSSNCLLKHTPRSALNASSIGNKSMAIELSCRSPNREAINYLQSVGPWPWKQ